jgi:hypothetical protein
MRLLITVLLSIMFTSLSFSQTTYTWTGAVNSTFSTAGNWSPVRPIGLTSDILIIGAGGNLNISNVSQVTVGELIIRNNSHVTLSPASGNPKTLFVNGGNGEDLIIEAGSSLAISSNEPALSLFIKSGATASIAGELSFTGTGMGTLNGADSISINFKPGSVFNQCCPGNIFTASGTKNAVVFHTGSTFKLNCLNALNPFGYPVPDSKVKFENGSSFVMCVTNSNALPLSGRVYSNLIIESNVFINANENFLNDVNINDITIKDNGSLTIKNLNTSNTAEINLKGSLNIQGYLCFADTTTSNKNISLNLNGTSLQEISGNGSITFTNLLIARVQNNLILYRDLTINCPSYITGQINSNGYLLRLSNNKHILTTGNDGHTGIGNNNPEQVSVKSQNNTEPPKSFSVSQNYPNPFNPSTKIDYRLAVDSKVSIKIFDINGREVAVIVDKSENAGAYSVAFDGSKLASGVYFYKLLAEGNSQVFSKTMKMLLVK